MSQNNKKKEDGRIRYTKMRIRSAFYELLKDKEYEKITVTAVCERAEINRATFYKHYLDIPDLVEKLQDETIQELSDNLEQLGDGSIEGFIAEVLGYIKKTYTGNAVFNALSTASSSGFSMKLSVIILNRFSQNLDSYVSQCEYMDRASLYSYICGGSAGLIDYWAKTEYKESETIIAKQMISLARSTLNNL